MSRVILKPPSKEAIAVYNYFKTLPGSEHIGKPVSIGALIDISNELKPEKILELGGGIGALSYTLLKYSSASIDIYEDNQFCIDALKKNLKEFEGRYHIIETYRMLPPAKEYDLVLIDGGTGTEGDGGYGLAARLFLLYLDRVKTVYIEGYRGMQRDHVRRTLRERYVCAFTVYKEIYSEGKKWHGGIKIECRKVTSSFIRWSFFLMWESAVWARQKYFYIKSLFKRTAR